MKNSAHIAKDNDAKPAIASIKKNNEQLRRRETVYIGLGSNIDAEKNLRSATAMLRKAFPGITFSELYRSAPSEVKDQPSFLNAAAVFETNLTSKKVGATLKTIEKKLKKNPPVRFGPRTIDLDLLLYGNDIGLEDELTIPHLRMHTRKFVLEPLIELGAGDLMHPGFDRKLKDFLNDVKGQECHRTKIAL